MKSNRWTFENIFYFLALGLALTIRLVMLKSAALNDAEAGWALQALGLARAQSGAIGPQPLYVFFTGLLFSVLDSDAFLARLLPALAGSLLVLFPILMRRHLGKTAALFMAFGLALDPALVYLSRTAGSQMPALAFGMLALAAGLSGKPAWAGFLAALALLSGPQAIAGLTGIGLAWIAGLLLVKAGLLQPLETVNLLEEGPSKHQSRWGWYLLAGTLLVAGTLFFRYPQGLGALADILPAYLNGWVTSSGIPALRIPAAWIVYQPLVFTFSVVGVIRAWGGWHPRSDSMRWLSLWAFFALAAAMLYPGRQVADLAWALIPLWALAAMELENDLAVEQGRINRFVSLGQAALIFILLVFAWLAMAGLSHFTGDMLQVGLRSAVFLVIGAAAMAAVTTLLVALGWNWGVARQGLVWGVALSLGLSMLSGMWGSAGLRAGGGQEIWSSTPSVSQADMLSSSISDLSKWNTGQDHNLQIVSLVNYPSLKWTLRNWPQTTFTSKIPVGDQPELIITPKAQAKLNNSQSYRGHEFAWEAVPDWQGILPPDIPSWLAFRDAPIQPASIILWARTSLFPGGENPIGTDSSNQSTLP